MSESGDQKPTVFVVDDDAGIRQGMRLLMQSVGYDAAVFPSANDFLEQFDRNRPGCLVLDIRMPGLGGLDLQERLLVLGSCMPIIFITGHGDVPMAVDAMQKGAFDFIQKPFRDQDLLERISQALSIDRQVRSQQKSRSDVAARLAKLTPREREVMDLVVKGKPNKVIAFELGTSQRTVEIHRSRVMDKMQARSLAELVRMNLQFEPSPGA